MGTAVKPAARRRTRRGGALASSRSHLSSTSSATTNYGRRGGGASTPPPRCRRAAAATTTPRHRRRTASAASPQVVDFLDGTSLCFLKDSGVVRSPHSGLLKKWTSRWKRNEALRAGLAFLDLSDLGSLVAAYFTDDPPLSYAAHTYASARLVRAPGRRRRPAPDEARSENAWPLEAS